jgi:hypothetical protein
MRPTNEGTTMSTADEVRSILREAGVPLTRKQVIEMLPDGCSDQAAHVFLSDAKKRGELEAVMEDGKAAYRFASRTDALVATQRKTSAPKPPAAKPAPVIAALPQAAAAVTGKREHSSLADLVGYTESALQAYIESCVDPTLYAFLLNARDAARREFERVHA